MHHHPAASSKISLRCWCQNLPAPPSAALISVQPHIQHFYVQCPAGSGAIPSCRTTHQHLSTGISNLHHVFSTWLDLHHKQTTAASPCSTSSAAVPCSGDHQPCHPICLPAATATTVAGKPLEAPSKFY